MVCLLRYKSFWFRGFDKYSTRTYFNLFLFKDEMCCVPVRKLKRVCEYMKACQFECVCSVNDRIKKKYVFAMEI